MTRTKLLDTRMVYVSSSGVYQLSCRSCSRYNDNLIAAAGDGSEYDFHQELSLAREKGWYVEPDHSTLCPNCTGLKSRKQVTEDEHVKQSNPKDAIGSTKLDMGLFPDTAVAAGALAFTEGALKYGRYNWRAVGVRASIYNAAVRRHLKKWWNGEELSKDNKLPHLYNALACIAILIDAIQADKMVDDRPPRVDITSIIDGAQEHIAWLKEQHADKDPYQYTILDEV